MQLDYLTKQLALALQLARGAISSCSLLKSFRMGYLLDSKFSVMKYEVWFQKYPLQHTR
jgi:hypothetical protein